MAKIQYVVFGSGWLNEQEYDNPLMKSLVDAGHEIDVVSYDNNLALFYNSLTEDEQNQWDECNLEAQKALWQQKGTFDVFDGKVHVKRCCVDLAENKNWGLVENGTEYKHKIFIDGFGNGGSDTQKADFYKKYLSNNKQQNTTCLAWCTCCTPMQRLSKKQLIYKPHGNNATPTEETLKKIRKGNVNGVVPTKDLVAEIVQKIGTSVNVDRKIISTIPSHNNDVLQVSEQVNVLEALRESNDSKRAKVIGALREIFPTEVVSVEGDSNNNVTMVINNSLLSGGCWNSDYTITVDENANISVQRLPQTTCLNIGTLTEVQARQLEEMPYRVGNASVVVKINNEAIGNGARVHPM